MSSFILNRLFFFFSSSLMIYCSMISVNLKSYHAFMSFFISSSVGMIMRLYHLLYHHWYCIHMSVGYFPSPTCFRSYSFEWREFMRGLIRLPSSSKTCSLNRKAWSWPYASLAGETVGSMLSTPCTSFVKTRRLSHGREESTTCRVRVVAFCCDLESFAV